ncbi:MAG: mechanosensitive ion channel [Deltaproteobacteria bacterium]|nr:mechanosensitive ion channel [Deltaproteobacteria bacterium]MBW2534162.1 mechanosensitive ion channel [Deltaproteobacteria bacterium]
MAHAVRYLDLRGLRGGTQSPILAARQLADALVHRVGLDVTTLSDVPEGDPADGADVERVGVVELADRQVPITLERMPLGGSSEWIFSRTTVARIPELGDQPGPDHWLVSLLPRELAAGQLGPLWTWQWIGLLLALLLAFPLGRVVAGQLLNVLKRLAERTPTSWDDAIVAHARRPVRFALGWLAGGLFAWNLALPTSAAKVVHLAVTLPLIVVVGWALVAAVRGFTEAYLQDLPDDREMNTRGLRTQVVLLRKLANVAIGLITISVVLMQFDLVRDVGLSLLASAGVAGVAIGIAAQKSLGAVIAGLQISITQPIRLGDAIIFQGQWGEVEEIALTYVRIKLWDERRLVVPVEKFLTEPFENWSKPGTEMIGVVELAVDPTAPIDVIRAELERLAAEHPHHDGRKCVVQVTDVNEQRALVRLLVSTSAVGEVFAMRCHIREGIMAFVQALDGGRYLPRQRWQSSTPERSSDSSAAR